MISNLKRAVVSLVLVVPMTVGTIGAQEASAAGLRAGTTSVTVHPRPECKTGYYKNSSGKCVKQPSSHPAGATAKCKDGTYSYSTHRSGTCSHHRGVSIWY